MQKAVAQNIQAGTVAVEVIGKYDENSYEVYVPSHGGRAIVRNEDLEMITDTEMRANRLIEWLTKNGIVADIMVSGDNECVSFEHFPRSFNEYVSIEVTEDGYTVGTCKAGEDADKNARTIKKEATMIKWLEKRIG